jgi:protein involved in polysaccharide export with SLBB domain
LKVGDAVHITVYPDTLSFLTGTYRLAEDGTIDLPMVGPFRIGDMSRLELEKRLAGHYLRYLRYPYVAITPLIRVGFVGGFGKPGFYYVNPNESFWEALRLSGGPLRNDGMRLVRWERDLTVVSGNIVPAIESGRSLHDLGIRSGDRFTVTTKPKRERIESFDQDVVPVLQVLLTTISASATLYIVYRTTGGH